ncbi:MAG: rRNA maturation RNase YbeY, partial [Nitrospirae bacterium]
MAAVLVSERVPLGLPAAEVERLLTEAMRLLGVDHEVSVTAVDEEEMAELNQGYRGRAGATDVLSF